MNKTEDKEEKKGFERFKGFMKKKGITAQVFIAVAMLITAWEMELEKINNKRGIIKVKYLWVKSF